MCARAQIPNATSTSWPEYSKETETLSYKEKTNTYFLSDCVIARVGYCLDAADIKPNKEFVAAIEEVVGDKRSATTLEKYLDLLGVLEKYGHFVLTECTVGGKLMVEKETMISNDQEAEQQRESFGAAVNADVTTQYGKFSGGGGYSQTDEEAKNHINKLAIGKFTTTVWGGMPALTGTIANWVESVNNPLTWAVVSYDQLTPTICYLPKPLRNRCMGLIDQHFLHEETRKRTVLDMNAYVAQLRESIFRAQGAA